MYDIFKEIVRHCIVVFLITPFVLVSIYNEKNLGIEYIFISGFIFSLYMYHVYMINKRLSKEDPSTCYQNIRKLDGMKIKCKSLSLLIAISATVCIVIESILIPIIIS